MSTFDFPVVITTAGVQPQSPSALLAQLIAAVAASDPGYTANLPASMIADIAGTDVGAMAIMDSAGVDLINSITPYGANEFLLTQIGNLVGVPINQVTNTSVYVIFSGPAGFVIAQGFIVSDGSNQYTVQDGGIIGSGGTTIPLFAVANLAGSFAVPANTVNQLVTSIPAVYTVTVNNPSDGLPSAAQETFESYRARVLMAYLAASQGMATYLRTLLGQVAGVQTRLISIIQGTGTWEIIVGGGDPYQVAYAIYSALFDVSTLVGSLTTPRNILVSISDFPNTYTVPIVIPPQEIVTMIINWSSTSPNYVLPATVAQQVQLNVVAYVNSVYVGQPMNLLQIKDAFIASLPSSIPESSIDKLDIAVYINSTLTPPDMGGNLISGDSESYFFSQIAGITVNNV